MVCIHPYAASAALPGYVLGMKHQPAGKPTATERGANGQPMYDGIRPGGEPTAYDGGVNRLGLQA